MGSLMDQIRPKYREIAIALLGAENLRTQDPIAEELRFGKKNGSLVVNVRKGIFHDWNGGAHGGILDLIEYAQDTNRTGAIRWLRERGFIERNHGHADWRKKYVIKKVAMAGAAKAVKPQAGKTFSSAASTVNPVTVATSLMRSAQVRDHEYMNRKRLPQTMTVTRDDLSAAGIRYLRTGDGYLDLDRPLIVCPMYRFDDQGLPRLATAELIDHRGKKATLPGRGHKIGAWCPAGPFLDRTWTMPVPEEEPIIIIAEGRADTDTASLSLNGEGESADYISIAALMATNLPAVAREWRRVYRGSQILIAADLNIEGLPHPMAVQAAEAVGGRVVHPGTGVPKDDFSDLYLQAGGGEPGLDAVRLAVAKTIVSHKTGPMAMPDDEASTVTESRPPNYD